MNKEQREKRVTAADYALIKCAGCGTRVNRLERNELNLCADCASSGITVPTFFCKQCGQDKPRREGRVFDKWVGVCRKCRAREASRDHYRVKARDKRDTEKLLERVRLSVSELDIERKAMETRMHREYMDLTRVIRNRIKLMEMNTNPSRKTEQALEKRREQLDKLDKARIEQRLALRASRERGEPDEYTSLFQFLK